MTSSSRCTDVSQISVTNLKEKDMAVETECQTSGAIFHVEINPREVICAVSLPFDLELSEYEAAILEANIHNAMELVLARYFKEDKR